MVEFKLKSDKEIDELFPPLDDETYSGLKKNVQKRGIQEQLTAAEDGTIVCGYNRYKVPQELELPENEIPYKTKKFSCRMEMIEYAIRDDVLRRQMNLWYRCELIDKMEKYAKDIMKLRMKVAGSKGGGE